MSNPIDDMLKERKKNYKFLKIDDGEKVHLLIKNYTKSPGAGFKGADTISFEVEVFDADASRKKIFQCTNPTFLKGVVALPKKGIGQEVLVKRIGEHTETIYEVKLFKEEAPPEDDDSEEEPPEPEL